LKNQWTNKKDYLEKIRTKKLEISMVGLGYVGLPLAIVLASKGFNVKGYDTDKKKVRLLNQGKSYLGGEKWLEDLIEKAKTFHASSEVDKSGNSDFIAITVPTPTYENKKPNYDFIRKAGVYVGKNLRKGSLVCLESTVGPGTTEGLLKNTLESGSKLQAGKDFGLAFSPERIDPAQENHRLYDIPKVVGGLDELSCDLAAEVYNQIVPFAHKVANTKEAELVKLTENVFRDLNIAFVNELAKVCDLMEVNVLNIIKAASTKPFAFMPHYPGLVGGHCLPDDPHFLIDEAKNLGFDFRLPRIAREINDSMSDYVVKKTLDYFARTDKNTKNRKVTILGLTYKENVSDMRNTLVKEITEKIEEKGIRVVAHDPWVGHTDFIENQGRIKSALKGTNVAILYINHDIFSYLTPSFIAKLAPGAAIIDLKNRYNRNDVEQFGLHYEGIGR